MFNAIAPNKAPYIWLLNVTLPFGMNLYNNINTINVAAINPTSVNIDDHIL